MAASHLRVGGSMLRHPPGRLKWSVRVRGINPRALCRPTALLVAAARRRLGHPRALFPYGSHPRSVFIPEKRTKHSLESGRGASWVSAYALTNDYAAEAAHFVRRSLRL